MFHMHIIKIMKNMNKAYFGVDTLCVVSNEPRRYLINNICMVNFSCLLIILFSDFCESDSIDK